VTESVRAIGVLGGGQLGWMLGIAARRLGIRCTFLDPAESCPSDMIGPRIRADYDDLAALDRLATEVDVVTYEFENVPASAAAHLASLLPVRPGPKSLDVAQDRLVEKRFIAALDIPVPRFAAIGGPHDLEKALDAVGVPAILKTRRGGYDGKGQARVHSREEAPAALADLAGAPAIAEAMVPFDLEASVLVVRGVDGETRTWTPSRNHHAGGILRRSVVPDSAISETATDAMRRHATTIATALEHVGVLAVEFFVVGDDVLVNEIAPRVHNSGHLTIEHAETSQFENHMRAVAGLPLGSTSPRFPHAVMLNGIGGRPDADALASEHVHAIDKQGDPQATAPDGGAFWHDYRKAPRPGRKIGHLTIVGAAPEATRIERLTSIVPGSA
jgi:5-(carboxyamino)imidazole ribonucleotide synthase